MTAIAAIVEFGGRQASGDDLGTLLGRMSARGPDGHRQWADGPVGLGEGLLDPHARALASLPVAEQGMATLGVLRIVWDGRLDNRAELIARLVALGDASAAQAPGLPDRDLVLRLFRHHGEALPALLLGDFAFAIWHAESQTLFCARDCMGARPFYYTAQPGYFALASEDEALLSLRGMDSAPNLDRVAYALCPAFDAFDWSKSWLEQVNILMPGTALTVTVSDGRVRLSTWWEPPRPELTQFSSDDEALEAFGAVMEQAVRDRTRDLGAIGLIASGGMDTATVAVAAAHVRDARPLRFFSAVDDDLTQCIESRAIEALASTLGADLHRLHVPSMRGMCCQADVDAFYERPHPVDTTIGLVAMMCLGASRAGQRVLLHGATGDLALHATSDYLIRFAGELGWRAAWREALAAQQHHTYVRGSGLVRLWLRSAYEEWMPPAGKVAWRGFRRRLRGAQANWINEAGDLGQQLQLAQRMRQESLRSERAAWAAPRTMSEHREALWPIGIVRGLEGYERVAGRYGIELRDPFADRRAIEFCLALPLHLRTRQGWTKFIARRWAGSELPAECVWRSDKEHLGHYL